MYVVNDTNTDIGGIVSTTGIDVGRPMKTADVARYIGQSERNVLRLVHNGQIPAKKLGSQFYFNPRKVAQAVGMASDS